MLETVSVERIESCGVRFTFSDSGFEQVEYCKCLLVCIPLMVAGNGNLLVVREGKSLVVILVLDVVLERLKVGNLVKNEILGEEVAEVLVVALADLTAEYVGLYVTEDSIALLFVTDILKYIQDVRDDSGVLQDENEEDYTQAS